jgi:transposase
VPRHDGGPAARPPLGARNGGAGHEVRLIAPRYVKPLIKRQKNDAADVEAIVEAALRPTMRYVAPTSGKQQARVILCSAPASSS